MRKTTKLVALLLAVMMIVSCVPMFVSAETAGSITVESKTVEPSEDQFTVEVTFTGSFLAAQFDLAYEGLELKGVECDALTITKVDGTNSSKAIIEAKQPENEQDPALADVTNPVIILTFDTPATAGNYTVSVSNVDAADYDENPVTFANAAGTITVKAAPVGPVEIPVTFNHSISLNSGIATNIYVLKTNELASCANLYMEITKDFYDANGGKSTKTSTVNVTSMTPMLVSGAYRYQFVYDGLDARELANNFTGVVFGVDGEGKIIYKSSNSDSYSLVTYCKNNFAKTDEDFKVVLADLLVYGSAAQVAFPYNVNNLSKDDPSVATYVATYATETDVTLTAESFHTGEQAITLANSADCESTIRLICAVPVNGVKGYDINSLNLKISYDGKTVQYPGNQFGNPEGSHYYIYFDQLLSTELSTPLQITLYSGDEAISKTRTYSVEAYCMSQINKPENSDATKTLYQKMMNFGYSCAGYFPE